MTSRAPTDYDALIVGAGPAGATAACLLARAGWSVALVEKQRFPRRKVCGECVAASNLPLLEALGIGAAFEADAGPALTRVALLRGAHARVAALPGADHPRHRWGRALGRETLDTLLLGQAAAAGAHVLQPWSVQAVEGVAGDWRIELRSIDTGAVRALRARVAIAANGSWETLPTDRTPRRAARRSSDLFAFKANFRGAALADGLLPVIAFDGGYGGMVVAGGGVTTLACCIRRDRLDALRSAAPGLRAGAAVEAALKRDTAAVGAALEWAVRDGAWLAAGPIDPGIRLRAGDTMFRIGNAAGEAHPILGEGMSMALQSAWLLCGELLAPAPGAPARGEPAPRAPTREAACGAAWQHEVAQRYAAQWRREFVPRLRLAAAFAHLAMRPAAAATLVALTRLWPGLLTAGARWGGKARCAGDPATMVRLAAHAAPAGTQAEAAGAVTIE